MKPDAELLSELVVQSMFEAQAELRSPASRAVDRSAAAARAQAHALLALVNELELVRLELRALTKATYDGQV